MKIELRVREAEEILFALAGHAGRIMVRMSEEPDRDERLRLRAKFDMLVAVEREITVEMEKEKQTL